MVVKIGFVGIGVMGEPMCLNLRKAGFALTVWARNPDDDRVRRVLDAGAVLVDSARAVAIASDVVVTMLPNSPDVEAVVTGPSGLLEGVHDGLIIADMSTIAPVMSRRLAAECAARGAGFLDAPVSGGSVGAQAGTLTIMVGGEAAVFARARPVFEAMGKKENVLHVGPSGAGETVKLINQHMCGAVAAASLEALVLGVKAGLDVETISRVVGVSTGASWQLTNQIPLRAYSGTFEPGFFTDLLAKDLHLVADMGEEMHVPLAMIAAARQMYEAARAQGHGRRDYTSVVLPLEEITGVQVRAKKE